MYCSGIVFIFVTLCITGGYCAGAALTCKKCEQTDTIATPDLSKCAATATEETCETAKTSCGAKIDTGAKKTTFGCFADADCSDVKYCCKTKDCNQAITGGKDLTPAAAGSAVTVAPVGAVTTVAGAGAAATTEKAKTGGAAAPAVSLSVVIFVALLRLF